MNCILYVAHKINKHSLEQYNKLKSELPSNSDLFWCTDFVIKSDIKIPSDIIFISYNTKDIYVQRKFYNPNYILENIFYKEYQQYDYYYIVEYDVYFSDNWSILFNDLNKYDYDLIATYIDIQNVKTYKDNPWMWYHDYEKWLDKRDTNIKKYLKSCLSFYRISKKALDFIVKYDKNNIKTFIYEFYIPTLLYNYGFSIVDLSKENKNEFSKFNYIETKFYGIWYCVKSLNKLKNDIKEIHRPILVTTYKDNK